MIFLNETLVRTKYPIPDGDRSTAGVGADNCRYQLQPRAGRPRHRADPQSKPAVLPQLIEDVTPSRGRASECVDHTALVRRLALKNLLCQNLEVLFGQRDKVRRVGYIKEASRRECHSK